MTEWLLAEAENLIRHGSGLTGWHPRQREWLAAYQAWLNSLDKSNT